MQHPKHERLLTSVIRPFGGDGEGDSVGAELFHAQVTRAQGPFSLRQVIRVWAIDYLAENVRTPTVTLHYPSEDELVAELRISAVARPSARWRTWPPVHLSCPPDGNTLYFGNADGTISSTRRISGSQFTPPKLELQNAGGPVLSRDSLTMYFARGGDIWVSTRANTNTVWPAGGPVTELNGASTEGPTDLSADGCTLHFTSDRPGTKLKDNSWSAKKPAK